MEGVRLGSDASRFPQCEISGMMELLILVGLITAAVEMPNH